MPKRDYRKGILSIGDRAFWNASGWKMLRLCTIWFAGLAFIASFAAMQNGGVTFNGFLVEGWKGVFYATGIAALTGALFGCIWLLLFKAMALASREK